MNGRTSATCCEKPKTGRLPPVRLSTAARVLLAYAGVLVLLAVCPWSQLPRTHAVEIVDRQRRIRPLVPGTPIHRISLRDRLLTGLQARLPSEIGFVDDVVEQVRLGRIPERLVNEMFFWARQRSSVHRRYGRSQRPIIYFRAALIRLAARIGVEF